MNKEDKEFVMVMVGAILFFLLLIYVIAPGIEKAYYHWEIIPPADQVPNHDWISLYPSEPLVLKGNQPITVVFKNNSEEHMGDMFIQSIETDENGKIVYSKKIYKLPIGTHELLINGKDELTVYVSAEGSYKQEPGFEGLMAIIAIICIVVIRKKHGGENGKTTN